MPSIPNEIDCNRILIVEGYSDLYFYMEMLEYIGRHEGVFVKLFHGKSNILKKETLFTYLSPKMLAEKKSIGILVDADDNPKGTIVALKKLLLDITGQDVQEGEWTKGSPSLGFFVAPSAEETGEIETLVWNAWAEEPANLAAAASIIEYIKKMNECGFIAHSPDKSKIGAFLSIAYDEDPRLGPAARQKIFDFKSPVFVRLRGFLELF